MLNLSEAALDFALSHVESRGDTDIFPLPFEYAAIRQSWDGRLKPMLVSKDLDTWAVRPFRRCLVPKNGLGLRVATQLDPLDTIIVVALVSEIATELEAFRVPLAKSVVHSHRLDVDATGRLYSPNYTFESFRRRSLDLARMKTSRWVVMTDIADFFPRLYAHPLENSLTAATSRPDHVRVLMKLISAWNASVSYGIPIGPPVFRLLSEVAISDVDQALLSERFRFCRFSDDYRIFTPSERRAHEALAFLANVLFKNHGLTLQEGKTEIIPTHVFLKRFEQTERDQMRLSLEERFQGIMDLLEVEEGYGVEFEDLDPETQEQVDAINLWELFEEQLDPRSRLDIPLTRSVLRRIKELELVDEHELLLSDLKRMHPVFREIIEAVGSQSEASTPQWKRTGKKLLRLFQHPVVGHLEYHRAWIISLFAQDPRLDQTASMVRLFNEHFDSFTRRELILALGRGREAYWFKSRKQEYRNFPDWERRAFLAAASCLPGDGSKALVQIDIPTAGSP